MKHVITGVRDGRSVFVHVGDVEVEEAFGMQMRLLWGHDQSPLVVPLPIDAGHSGGYLPDYPGIRASLIHFLPDRVRAEASPGSSKDATLNAAMSDGDGLHATDTVDIGWVIRGELGLQLETGETVWLSAGDMVVQNGTPHRWLNRQAEPAVAGFVSVGAKRRTDGNG